MWLWLKVFFRAGAVEKIMRMVVTILERLGEAFLIIW
jgi:hypothetical protein